MGASFEPAKAALVALPNPRTKYAKSLKNLSPLYVPKLYLLLAAVVLVLVCVAKPQGVDSDARVLIDGLDFAPSIKMSGISQQLIGGGTRLKYNVVKIYAVGVYMDAAGAKRALKPYLGLAAGALQKQAGFYKAVIEARFAKALLLYFHRSVGSSAVVDALRDSLAPRLKAPSLAKFREVLQQMLGDSVPKGSQLFFSCRGDNLHMSVSSSSSPLLMQDKTICAALFDVYLGSSPISMQAKEGFTLGFAERVGA
eukprot:CAMPEP_0119335536 /NCGR_PEP_ID=MMETSP1333-20130426/89796_1 /TAXON_ID=418940 /ORGANISM="Scyphosphaera apsteinii, Strain RCC1455" /LENGTH=253 /DNA_ID=CAMNT_0007346109 /DNA_START=23 /DNA_END=784 /DNA_ORIENTATION=+